MAAKKKKKTAVTTKKSKTGAKKSKKKSTKKAAPKKAAKRASAKASARSPSRKAAPKRKSSAPRASRPTARIEDEVVIRAAPESVFDALVIADQHAQFTNAPATGDASEGAEFTAWDGYISGRHVELRKPELIVQEWQTVEWPAGYGPSRLTFRLESHPDGTLLRLVHEDVPKSQAPAYAEGWREHYFEPLVAHFS